MREISLAEHFVRHGHFTKFSKICYFIGLFGFVIFFVLIILSQVFAIRNGYDYNVWEISDLVVWGEESKWLYISSMIIIGISLLFPVIPLAFYFTNRTKRIFVLIFDLLIGITLIGIGTVSKYEYFILHWSIVAIFFTSSNGSYSIHVNSYTN